MPTSRDSADGCPVVVVMGVSAVGKSTVASSLAVALGAGFVDADSLHPPANIAKMAQGVPLDDEDRAPWLDTVGHRLADGRRGGGIVVACSALRRRYRDRLRAAEPAAVFVHLTGSVEVLTARALGRTGHFMPPALLDSQLRALEPLEPDERGIVIDVAAPVAEIVASARVWLRSTTAGDAREPGVG